MKKFKKPDEEALDVERQYQFFLKKMNLSEETMHPVQKVQLRQAFYGAAGQIFILLRDQLTAMPEHTAMLVLERMQKQVFDFWKEQVLIPTPKESAQVPPPPTVPVKKIRMELEHEGATESIQITMAPLSVESSIYPGLKEAFGKLGSLFSYLHENYDQGNQE